MFHDDVTISGMEIPFARRLCWSMALQIPRVCVCVKHQALCVWRRVKVLEDTPTTFQIELATYQLGSWVYWSTSLTSASPHWLLFQVFGNTTVPLTTFCSLLIWFSPRLALFPLCTLCSLLQHPLSETIFVFLYFLPFSAPLPFLSPFFPFFWLPC